MIKTKKNNLLPKKIKNPPKKPSLPLTSIKESWKLSKNKSPCSNSKKENFYKKSN